jgi:ubiquinone/menaquinone biosynthesis C-methylase UbiE
MESSEVNWDRLASAYPRQVWLERSSLTAGLDLLDPRPDDRLLDIGTGTAELLRSLSKRRNRPERAIGIDPCRNMLRQARALPEDWRLVEAGGEEIPFADESFDVVTASYLLHVLDPATRRRVVDEVTRVLKPGGRMLTVTIAPPVSSPAKVLTAPIRWFADRYPSRLIGLRPLDPAADLERGGLSEVGRRRDFRGYPALCLLAVRPG